MLFNSPKLKKNKIIIYTTKLSSCIDLLPLYWSYLSSSEKKQATLYLTDKLAGDYIISRGFLREKLAYHIKVSPNLIEFFYGNNGKPFLKNNTEDLQFNISHSNDRICMAVTQNQQVGVDIEFRDKSLNHEELYEFVLSNEELQFIQNLDKGEIRQMFFYNFWSKKEAIVKALGKGFDYPINNINLIKNDTLVNFAYTYNTGEERKWYYLTLNLDDYYSSAVACENKHNKIVCIEFYSH